MNEKNVPARLRHLIPLVTEYGIGDDFLRDENIKRRTSEELHQVILVCEESEVEIGKWLFGEEMTKEGQTLEYVNFTNFTMAVDMASAVLAEREGQK